MVQIADPVVRAFLKRKLGVIKRTFEPQHVILFGSRAQGTAGGWSDIDPIIVSPEFRSVPFAERAVQFYQAVRPDIHVDVLRYTPEEFENKRHGINIVSEALLGGIRIE